jgi:hypothetical protein
MSSTFNFTLKTIDSHIANEQARVSAERARADALALETIMRWYNTVRAVVHKHLPGAKILSVREHVASLTQVGGFLDIEMVGYSPMRIWVAPFADAVEINEIQPWIFLTSASDEGDSGFSPNYRGDGVFSVNQVFEAAVAARVEYKKFEAFNKNTTGLAD